MQFFGGFYEDLYQPKDYFLKKLYCIMRECFYESSENFDSLKHEDSGNNRKLVYKKNNRNMINRRIYPYPFLLSH